MRGRLARRGAAAAVVVALVAVSAASLSLTLGRTIQVVDAAGRPVPQAFVRFHYEGDLINFVHPVRYRASGSTIVEADEGLVTIPARLHLRPPLPLSSGARLFIDQVYVPALHNAFGPVTDLTMDRPGVFTIDRDRGRVLAHDVGGDPERWQQSQRYLFDMIRSTLRAGGAERATDPESLARARRLAGLLREEHHAFLARYGSARREPPPMPEHLRSATDEERAEWQAAVAQSLEREPTWGALAERLWERTGRELELGLGNRK